jgi:hypothetical protein
MAYGNYGFYDAENAAEQQKRAAEQQAYAQEMERRRQEQMNYDRQRQAFQEQVVAQEQARKKSETDNQHKVGMAAANSKKDLVDSMVRGGLFNAFAPFRQSLVN